MVAQTLKRPEALDPDTGHSIFTLMRDRPLRVVPGEGRDEVAVHNDGLRWRPPAEEGADATGMHPAVVIDQISTLEREFPGVAALLQRVWGRPEAMEGFRKLFLDKRGMVRNWPAAVWDELVLLWDLHQAHVLEAGGAGAADTPIDPHRFSILERGYGHVVERLIECWRSPAAFALVFEDLILDSRGDREGWPAGLWRELLFLQELRHRVQHEEEAARLRLQSGAEGAAAELPDLG